MSLILGVPAAVLSLQQQGLLERAFHDGLFPNLAFRAEFLAEKWEGNTGEEVYMSRPGLLTPIVTPNAPGADPVPQTPPYEQWSAILSQYAGTIDTDMPQSATAHSNLFLRNIHQLGLQAGQSVNRIARNALFKTYLSGSTCLIAAALITDTSIRVASLNGFRDVVIPGSTVRPAAVSTSNPLPIRLGAGGTTSANVVGYVADDPTDLDGPGTLLLSAGLAAGLASRIPCKSLYAPRIVRAAGGDSIDSIGAADTMVLQLAINACAFLRRANVQPHEDGFYHAHISPLSNAQVFADPVFQRLNQSLPEHVTYKEGFIGTISGVMFFMNTESPEDTNTGTLVATAGSAYYSKEMGAEVINNAGTKVGRVLITGKGVGYERRFDEANYSTEAGTTGKIGEFEIINNGIQILTEGIRLVLRSPQDRLQQKVSASWSITTAFAMPSDITAPGGSERFRRGIILEHAL